MRRFSVVLPVLIVILLGLFAVRLSGSTSAQEGTPTAGDQHPLIGAWVADTNVDDPANPPSLLIFHDDGTFIELEVGGGSGLGAWEATGPTSADLTILFPGPVENGEFAGHAKVRVHIEVDELGDTFAAMYTVEFPGPDGASSGELGPASVTAERITVEPMGTPVGPLTAPAGTPTS